MNRPILIGCSLNYTYLKNILKKPQNFYEEITESSERDFNSGADYLNINVDAFKNSVEKFELLIKRFSHKHEIGFSIESLNYETMLKFARIYPENLFLNSFSISRTKTENLNHLLDFAKMNHCNIIIMPYDKRYPKNAVGRIKLSEKIYRQVLKSEVYPSNIFIDVVALPIIYAPEQYYEMLLSITLIKKLFCCKTVVGLDNLVYNLDKTSAKKNIKIFTIDVLEKGIDAILVYKHLEDVNQQCEKIKN